MYNNSSDRLHLTLQLLMQLLQLIHIHLLLRPTDPEPLLFVRLWYYVEMDLLIFESAVIPPKHSLSRNRKQRLFLDGRDAEHLEGPGQTHT